MGKTKTEDCGKAKTPLFYWNTGKLDSMLPADNLLRERLAMIYDDDSLNPCTFASYIRKRNIDEIKKYCNKENNREELRELKYDSYHPIYVACKCYDLEILSYLLELKIFDDWQVNDMYSSLLEEFKKKEKKEEKRKNEEDILNMIKYYANTCTKRARST